MARSENRKLHVAATLGFAWLVAVTVATTVEGLTMVVYKALRAQRSTWQDSWSTSHLIR
jgi:UPF0716 family protein affecting phage T7 exclusion